VLPLRRRPALEAASAAGDAAAGPALRALRHEEELLRYDLACVKQYADRNEIVAADGQRLAAG
jgi:hypothetical protein